MYRGTSSRRSLVSGGCLIERHDLLLIVCRRYKYPLRILYRRIGGKNIADRTTKEFIVLQIRVGIDTTVSHRYGISAVAYQGQFPLLIHTRAVALRLFQHSSREFATGRGEIPGAHSSIGLCKLDGHTRSREREFALAVGCHILFLSHIIDIIALSCCGSRRRGLRHHLCQKGKGQEYCP